MPVLYPEMLHRVKRQCSDAVDMHLNQILILPATYERYIYTRRGIILYLESKLLNEETKQLDEYEYEFLLFWKTLVETEYEF